LGSRNNKNAKKKKKEWVFKTLQAVALVERLGLNELVVLVSRGFG